MEKIEKIIKKYKLRFFDKHHLFIPDKIVKYFWGSHIIIGLLDDYPEYFLYFREPYKDPHIPKYYFKWFSSTTKFSDIISKFHDIPTDSQIHNLLDNCEGGINIGKQYGLR